MPARESELLQKILTVERDFLSRGLGSDEAAAWVGGSQRRAVDAPAVRAAGVNRSSLYYEPVEPDTEELELMRRMDELHLKHPFFGSRMMTRTLKAEGVLVNRKRVQRLNGSCEHRAEAEHQQARPGTRCLPVFAAESEGFPDQSDITYIPMARGFVFLMAIIDWYSRRILAWRLSTTLETSFCVEALHEALARYGCPEIFNTDQGSQFTSEDFTDVLLDRGNTARGVSSTTSSSSGWRSLKYEEVYLYAYDNVPAARAGIARYFDFFNDERPHEALGYQTPASFYDGLVNDCVNDDDQSEKQAVPKLSSSPCFTFRPFGRLRKTILRSSRWSF